VDYSSKLLENAVEEMARFPGIGKRSALRLILHLLNQPEEHTIDLAKALIKLRTEIKFCRSCHNISDTDVCEICSNKKREKGIICVVEDIRDVMAIENTQQYNGIYHVLGGKISPMDGVGPQHLNIQSLVDKVRTENIDEIIFALSSTMEGDTTNFYIYKQLEGLNIKTTTIARGISVGDELEFADQITLGRSITHRLPFEDALKQ
jgi:recombination protein RecR